MSYDCHSENIILREIRVNDKVRHANLVSIEGLCIRDKEVIFLMPLIDHNTLFSVLFGKTNVVISSKLLLHIARKVLEGLAYLHLATKQKPAVVHGDLKPSNILVTENKQIMICDFGMSRLYAESGQQSKFSGISGTLKYMPPEMLVSIRNQQRLRTYGP